MNPASAVFIDYCPGWSLGLSRSRSVVSYFRSSVGSVLISVDRFSNTRAGSNGLCAESFNQGGQYLNDHPGIRLDRVTLLSLAFSNHIRAFSDEIENPYVPDLQGTTVFHLYHGDFCQSAVNHVHSTPLYDEAVAVFRNSFRACGDVPAAGITGKQ